MIFLKVLGILSAMFLLQKIAVAMYFCMIDSQTPFYAKGVIAAALAYFLSPTDAIPDAIAVLGFTDDASVIATDLATVSTHVTDEHKQKANEFFNYGISSTIR